jgi:hypothetical protein
VFTFFHDPKSQLAPNSVIFSHPYTGKKLLPSALFQRRDFDGRELVWTVSQYLFIFFLGRISNSDQTNKVFIACLV